MTRLRTVLVLGIVVVAAVGGGATAWVVQAEARAALEHVLAVQTGTLLALAIAVWVLLAPTVSRLDDLVEALRAFARGERHTRVNPADFAGLADVARAVNDVGASLCENDDPNLGPVQRKAREQPARPPSEEPRPSLVQPDRSVPLRPTTPVRRPVVADGDVVGEVRRRPRDLTGVAPPTPAPVSPTAPTKTPTGSAPEPASPSSTESQLPDGTTPPTEPPRPIAEPEGISEPRSRKNRRKAKKAAALAASRSSIPQPAIGDDDDTDDVTDTGAGPTSASASGEDAVDAVDGTGAASLSSDASEATGPASSVEAPATVIEPAPEMVPSRDELQRLFDEFRREKRAAGQGDDVDVDFDAFADTIVGESERLVAEHRCRGVRFEVAVAGGEVSLRPRLLR